MVQKSQYGPILVCVVFSYRTKKANFVIRKEWFVTSALILGKYVCGIQTNVSILQ
jgi:hypothetical protein